MNWLLINYNTNMQISVITLFPDMFQGVLNSSILKRAVEKGKVSFNLINLRDFGLGAHKTVDDKPYGGGAGMVLKVDVLHEAVKKAKEIDGDTKIVLLDPRGVRYSQEVAENLSKESSITLICGHYEGYDERIREYVDMEISMGDFVVTGGEIPAMAIIDSTVRLLPGVLGKEESHQLESFSHSKKGRILEHAQYTRPQTYNGVSVPEYILTGNHKQIEEERAAEAAGITAKNRPDLLKK